MTDDEADSGEAFDALDPGTDLMAALIAVLLLLLVIARAAYSDVLGGDTDLRYVGQNQQALVSEIASSLGGLEIKDQNDPDRTTIVSGDTQIQIAEVQRAALSQTFSFGDGILFKSAKSDLTPEGQLKLAQFLAPVIARQDALVEIQIQGHADTIPIVGTTNLKLGADRAVAVYDFFVAQGLDPSRTLLSATSFGEFKPSGRLPEIAFDAEQLAAANRTKADRDRNRRIEVVLTYSRVRERPNGSTAR
jgi:outer membrane protein OmpA-like peptidoglycan-associated protein